MEILEKAKNGVFYTIESYSKNAPLALKRRILELGLTPGQKVRIVRKSLLGKAYLIEVRGYTLSMRKSLLSYINVER